MPTLKEIQRASFLRDLYVPLPGSPVVVTASGDWPTIEGLANLRHAMVARATTAPGDLVFRPNYGGDLVSQIERISSEASRVVAANAMRANALRDPRVAEVEVEATEEEPGTTIYRMTIQPQGDATEQAVAIQGDG